MQHQKAIVKKKVPEGEVLSETGSFAALPMPSPLGVEGGTKCRMRGEQPLAPSSGAPSFVCSLRSQPPVPHFVTCGDISPRSGENLSPTGGRLYRKPLGHCNWAASSPSQSPAVTALPKGEPLAKPKALPYCQSLSLWERWICAAKTERARTLSSGQSLTTIHCGAGGFVLQ